MNLIPFETILRQLFLKDISVVNESWSFARNFIFQSDFLSFQKFPVLLYIYWEYYFITFHFNINSEYLHITKTKGAFDTSTSSQRY